MTFLPSNQIKYLFFLLINCAFPLSSWCQAPSLPNCGFQVDHQLMTQIKEHQAGLDYWATIHQQQAQSRSSNSLVIPLFFHVATLEGSSIMATDLATIEKAVEQVNTFFENTEFQFVLEGTSTLVDNNFYRNGSSSDSQQLLTSSLVPNAVNVFVVKTIDPERQVTAYARFGEYIVIAEKYLMHSGIKATLSHELGHYFGLFHTHGKYNSDIEDCNGKWDSLLLPIDLPPQVFCEGAVRFNDPLIDTNNDNIPDCAQTGDDVCDTPAEPKLSSLVTINCDYIGANKDFYNEPYLPRTDNIMSYAFNLDKDCRSQFTKGQSDRMFAFLMEFNQQLLCATVPPTAGRVIVVDNAGDACSGSLRWAIELANVRKGMDTIIFDPAYFSESRTIMLSKELAIGSDLTLIGNDHVNISSQPVFSGLEKNITPSVFIKGNNVVVKNLSIIDMPSSGLVIDHATNVAVSNLKISKSGRSGIFIRRSNDVQIDSVSTNQNNGNGILAYISQNVDILHSEIQNNSSLGLNMDSINHANILHCIIQANEDNGVFIENGSKNISILHSEVNNNGFHGIAISDSEEIKIDSVKCNQSVQTGMAIFDSQNLSILNCELSNNEGNGMLTINSSNIAMRHAAIGKNDRSGIYSFNSAHLDMANTEVINNVDIGLEMDSTVNSTISNCRFAENENNGIFITNESQEIEIVDSELTSNEFHGISISASSATINNLLTTANERAGIAIFNNSTVDIQQSYTYANNRQGILLFNTIHTFIDRTSIYDNLRDGIFIGAISSATINESQIYQNGFNGVVHENYDLEDTDLSLPARVEISSSTINDNGRAGILDEANKTMLIRNSTIYCNTDAQIDNENERLVANITTSTRDGIEGVAIPNSEIFIYQNDADCSSCNAAVLLGTTMADENGNWQFSATPLIDTMDVQVTSIAISENKTSTLAECIAISELITSTDDLVQTNNSHITITPNPSMGQVTIFWESSHLKPTEARLVDLLGRPIVTLPLTPNIGVSYDLSNYPNGIYFLQIKEHGQLVKIIKGR